MKKNNLDDLYREKLKDFQELPDATVWARIAASLDKKKKKRVIPIWWQLGGVAALLAVLFYIFSPSTDENIIPDQPVVGTQKSATETQGKDIEKDSNLTPISSDLQEAPQVVENEIPVKEETMTKPDGTDLPGNKRNDVTQKGAPSDGIATAANEKRVTPPEDPQSLVERESQNQNFREQQENNSLATENVEKEAAAKTKDALDAIIPEKQTEEAVAQQEVEENTTSIFEAIEKQKELEEEALAENRPNNRWSMGPAIAPVYFNSLGEGSPIHSNFAPNSKSGKVNLSYGLMVSYNVSKKLSIRSGVHMVDFGYDTNDVVFTSSLATPSNALIDNIDYAQNSRNLVVESKASSPPTVDSNAFAGEISPLEGRMVQQLGYVEVPMELNYALVNRKFGVNIIGGISSLFLVDNAVTLESEGLITEMGEANNVNNVNFSTNIGVGLNYEIAPKIQLNLEPMFKYQLNTFSEIEGGNFRPYSVGVYSGLSFRF